MQTTTLHAIVSEHWQPKEGAGCLYLIRAGATIIYVEQAHDPCWRIKQHVGATGDHPQPSPLGQWLLRHAPRSFTLHIDVLGLDDLPADSTRYRPPSLRWWYHMLEPAGQDAWEVVYQAEYALIRYYRPCLNERYNQGVGRTAFPADYAEPG